jgi:hypothetical protein
MLRLRIGLAMALVVSFGCAPRADEVEEEGEKSVESWGKTLEMVCGQWAEERVPTLYVKQIFKGAEEALGEQLKDLEKLGANEDAQRVVRKINRLKFWIEQNQERLGEADGEKRREILATLRRAGEGA